MKATIIVAAMLLASGAAFAGDEDEVTVATAAAATETFEDPSSAKTGEALVAAVPETGTAAADEPQDDVQAGVFGTSEGE